MSQQKLLERWGKDSGGSEKQFTDARGVYELQFNDIDQAYLDHWAPKLDIVEELAKLKKVAEPLRE